MSTEAKPGARERALRRGAPVWSTMPGSAKLALAVFVFITILVILAPWLAPFDPDQQNLEFRLVGPSSLNPVGTDHLGRDVFSRILHGGRYSLTVAGIVVVIAGTWGTAVGALSGRMRGWRDEALMRGVDLLLSMSEILVAIVLVALLGAGFGVLIMALALLAWTPFARLARGLTLELNTTLFVQAAEALGCSRSFIVWRHIVPNMAGPMFAMFFLRFGHLLITAAGLSFLGLGAQPPTADWGAMLSDALPFMQRVPLLVLAPGLMIFVMALTVTVAGQGVSLALDPRSRGRETARRLRIPGRAGR